MRSFPRRPPAAQEIAVRAANVDVLLRKSDCHSCEAASKALAAHDGAASFYPIASRQCLALRRVTAALYVSRSSAHVGLATAALSSQHQLAVTAGRPVSANGAAPGDPKLRAG